MKIECKAIRTGGTRVNIGKTEYHFEPLEDGAHVADIENADHIDRFLSISDAYRVYHGKHAPKGEPTEIKNAAPAAKPISPSDPSGMLLGSSVHESSYDIGGTTYSLGDVVAKAYTASGLSLEDWNLLEEEDRHAKIDIALDELAEAADQSGGTVDPDAERDALVEQFKAKFGKAPAANAKIETIKARLAE